MAQAVGAGWSPRAAGRRPGHGRRCRRCLPAATAPEAVEATVAKPLGVVLSPGPDDVGAWVAEVADDGNSHGSVRPKDVVASVGGAPAARMPFDDVLQAVGAQPDDAVALGLRRWDSSTTPEGLAWLAAHAELPDVVVTESGLQYRVLSAGGGSRVPGVATKCRCSYAGRLCSTGAQFDAGAATFQPRQVIKGWTEALLLMREGDTLEVAMPAELGYGARGSGRNIGPNQALVFEVTLDKVILTVDR